METTNKLTQEKFNEIYTNSKFCNTVANAHGCLDQYGNFKHLKTCSYPIAYIVSEEQKNEAKKVKENRKKTVLQQYNSKENIGVLALVAMGMNFDKNNTKIHENLQKSDIENYRVRGYFSVNSQKYFIEFSTDKNHLLHVNFSIKYIGDEEKYNYKNLERKCTNFEYTKESILKIINHNFKTNFKSVIIDRHDISPEDFCSISIK